jgi:membrane associated rhomboid family serine protease
MIPLRDYLPTRRPSVVNTALIALNIGLYLYFFGLTFSPGADAFNSAGRYFVIPALVSHGQALGTLVTAMFFHASLLHLAGNMLFLYIFGNNVEDALGRVKYIVFYLACGIIAGLAQCLVDPGSEIPSLGASGAIAGVLAAYVTLYPRARIGTLILFGFIPLFFRLRAIIVIGVWIALQLLSGYSQLGVPGAMQQGGVGYFAHIGGFFAGFVLIRIMRPRGATSWR